MAFVRLVVGDQSSAEVDQLRRTSNALIQVLANLADATFTTLADFQEALANTISTGVDGDFTTVTSANSYVGTGLELVGLRPMNRHPRRPGGVGQTVAMTVEDGSQ